jgi:hypothetical protein
VTVWCGRAAGRGADADHHDRHEEMRRICAECPVLISRLGDDPAPTLHGRSRAGVRPSVSASTSSPAVDAAPPDALVVYRAEVYLDDGCWSRAQWLGRAEYPDLSSAKLWLLDTLESLRGRAGHGVVSMVWGEVTAGRFQSRVLDPVSGIMFSAWSPIEDWGASGTAYLPGVSDAVVWDSDQVFKVADHEGS